MACAAHDARIPKMAKWVAKQGTAEPEQGVFIYVRTFGGPSNTPGAETEWVYCVTRPDEIM